VSKIEKGQIPSLDKLSKLCAVYGITVPSLFGEEESVPEILKEFGVEWISVLTDIRTEKLTTEEIQNIINVIKSLKLK
jgi:transcriptional regulator with XRE-family HTH domain